MLAAAPLQHVAESCSAVRQLQRDASGCVGARRWPATRAAGRALGLRLVAPPCVKAFATGLASGSCS